MSLPPFYFRRTPLQGFGLSVDENFLFVFLFSFVFPLSTVNSLSPYLFLTCKVFVEEVQYGFRHCILCDQSLNSDLGFLNLHLKNYFMCMGVLPSYIFKYYVYAMPVEIRKGHHILWN